MKFELVRGEGLEPSRLSAYAPQTYVSTNSTILANTRYLSLFIIRIPKEIRVFEI